MSLAEHALILRVLGQSAIDGRVESVTDAYRERRQVLQPNRAGTMRAGAAHESAEQLVEVWRDRAAMVSMSGLRMSGLVPGALPELARRDAIRQRLAEGSVQQFVAAQLAVLELLTYVTVAERPALQARARAVLSDSAETRSRLSGVLEQAVEVERTIANMWDLRLREREDFEGGPPS